MSRSFGQSIKIQRILKNLTQGQVCEQVKRVLAERGVAGMVLTQPTLSAWEKDRQLPSGANIAVLQSLERVLKLPPSVVQNVLKNTGKHTGLAPDDIYAEDVGEWAAAACAKQDAITGQAQIWFLAPNTLPAFLDTTDRLFRLWEDNVVLGVHYHLLWILEETADSAVFAKLGEYLNELSKEVGKRTGDLKGSVKVYLVRRPRTVARGVDRQKMDRNEKIFKRMCDVWPQGSRGWITWLYLKEFDSTPGSEDRDVYDLIENVRSQLFGRLAIYLGAPEPEAGLLLTGTSSRRGGEPSRSYRWLDKEAAAELAGVVDTIETWITRRIARQEFEYVPEAGK